MVDRVMLLACDNCRATFDVRKLVFYYVNTVCVPCQRQLKATGKALPGNRMVVPPKGIHFDEMYQPPQKPQPRPAPASKPASDLLVPKWDNSPPQPPPPPPPIPEPEPVFVPEPIVEYEDNKPEVIEVLVKLGYKNALAKRLAFEASQRLPRGATTEALLAEVFRANQP